MNRFGNGQIKTCRKIRTDSALPGGKQVGTDDPRPMRPTQPVGRMRDRFGSKARERRVPSPVWKHVLFPKYLAIQIRGTKQVQTGNASIRGEKIASWGRQGFGTAAGRFLGASQKRRNLSNISPHEGDSVWRTPPHPLPWNGYTLCTTITHLPTEFLTVQLIPQTPRQPRGYFLISSFSVSLSTCRPQNTSQFSRGSFMTATDDVKSFTSSYL